MATPVRYTPQVIVQANTSLTDSDASWQTLPLTRFESASDGAGQIAGDAEFEQTFGLVTTTNDPTQTYDVGTVPTPGTPGPNDALVGQLIRLLVSDDAGAIDIGDQSYTAFWWGKCVGFTVLPDARSDAGAGGVARYRCLGIASVLDSITVYGGFCYAPDNSGLWEDPGFFPPFNDHGGDMSSDTYDVNGTQCHVHDLSTLSPVGVWDAASAVTLLLAGLATPAYPDPDDADPAGFTWALSDPQNVLNYLLERVDINGRTLAEALNILIDPRRGITWTVSVNGSVATVNVWSGSPTDITITGTFGSYTLPASNNTSSYSVAGNAFTTNVNITSDQSSTYDIIEVRGERPWVGITVTYDGTTGIQSGLIKGWDPSLEAGWATYPTGAAYESVWRLFQLNPNWNGIQALDNTNGMRNALGLSNPGGGYDGTRQHLSTGNSPATLYAMERTLPCGVTFTNDRLGPRQLPIVIQGDGTDTNWIDCANGIELAPGYTGVAPSDIAGNAWGIDCQTCPPFLRLDDANDGQDIADLLDPGGSAPPQYVIATIGLRETQPLKVSYIFDQGTWPSSTPRIKMIDVPGLELWTVLAGTVTGVDDTGALTTLTDDLVVRDDTTKAQQLLALAVARYGFPIVNASWTERFLLDTDSDLSPGTMLMTVTTGTGDVYVGSVITRRTWQRVVIDGVDTFETSYETTRVTADVGVMMVR